MANTKSAAKRARQTERRTAINRRVKARVKTALKRAKDALTLDDKTRAGEIVRKVQAVLDRAAKTGQIHKNKAARHKSQFSLGLAAKK